MGLVKSFPGVCAVGGVSLEVRRGEVHAVLGENGAGKSTLMKVLAGLELPDAGTLEWEGRPVRIRSPHEAARLGIAMIHQELMPFPDLTVAENLFMGRERAGFVPGWIHTGRLQREARTRLAQLGVDIPPQRRMGDLTVAQMQTVEIARALLGDVRLLIMDEPTSAISDREVEALLRLVDDLRRRGVSVLYISHRLEEVFRIADRVTVLRDGNWVGTAPTAELTADRLIRMMVGRDVGTLYPSCPTRRGKVALKVCGLARRGAFRDVNLTVHCGEIVGLAGLMGAGRSEVLSAIYGLEPADTGSIFVRGRLVRIRRPSHALRLGIGWVTEDRQREGLVPGMSVGANLTLASLARWTRLGWVDTKAEGMEVDRRVQALGIRGAAPGGAVRTLSGGNQQKVVLGRALATEPDILLLDEPTRGIDIGARAEIYRLIVELAESGKAIVMVSSDLAEVMALSQRLVVMREGEVAAELDPRRVTADDVLRHAMPRARVNPAATPETEERSA